MARWTREQVERRRFDKAKSRNTARPKTPPVDYYIAGVEDAKDVARDPRTDLAALERRYTALHRDAEKGLGLYAQRLASYYRGASSTLAYEIRRRAAGPEQLVYWGGDQIVDRQALKDEMRRAAVPAPRELSAATA